MRYYSLDELQPAEMARLKAALAQRGCAGAIEDIYYYPVPEADLTPEQRDHLTDCGPYVLALETGEDWLRLELLVRAKGRLRCGCIAYAAPEVRARAMAWVDALLRELDIQG